MLFKYLVAFNSHLALGHSLWEKLNYFDSFTCIYKILNISKLLICQFQCYFNHSFKISLDFKFISLNLFILSTCEDCNMYRICSEISFLNPSISNLCFLSLKKIALLDRLLDSLVFKKKTDAFFLSLLFYFPLLL